MSTDLHHGFADVNRAAAPQTLFDFLELVNSLPAARAYKQAMRSTLNLQPGETVLDVGCGIGIEARRIARDFPEVHVAGLDREAMIAEAKLRSEAEGVDVRWIAGQAEHIPLPDSSIDACMTERVLMYLTDPTIGIAEMVRVLKPGGRISCFELDYAATMLGGDPEMATFVSSVLNATVSEPRMGRRLPTILHEKGLRDLTIHPVIFCPPWPVFEATIARTVRDAIEHGSLAAEPAQAWLESLAEAARTGQFYTAFIGMVVSARRAS